MGPVTICSVDGELKRSVKQRGSIEHVAGGCHTDIGFEILKSPLKPFSILSMRGCYIQSQVENMTIRQIPF